MIPNLTSPGALLTEQRRKISIFSDDATSSEIEHEASDALYVEEESSARAAKYVKKSAPKSRKSEPVKKLRRDEYDEDAGRTESQYVFFRTIKF
jgi:hypothetical protein